MEALAQQLQDAFTAEGKPIAVYLGSEWLDRQPELPHVIVVPGNASYTPSDGTTQDTLADVQLDTVFICKAMTFEDAALLADYVYATLAEGRDARMNLRTEVWGDYNVRVAQLSVTYPARLRRSDVTRLLVDAFTQYAQFTTRTQEVPDDPTHQPNGETHFVESD